LKSAGSAVWPHGFSTYLGSNFIGVRRQPDVRCPGDGCRAFLQWLTKKKGGPKPALPIATERMLIRVRRARREPAEAGVEAEAPGRSPSRRSPFRPGMSASPERAAEAAGAAGAEAEAERKRRSCTPGWPTGCAR